MPYYPRNGPKQLNSILDELISSKGWEDRLKEIALPEYWKEVVGSAVADKAQFKRFDDGTIFVSTVSSTWRTELQLRSDLIIKQLNNKLGKEKVKEIKFI